MGTYDAWQERTGYIVIAELLDQISPGRNVGLSFFDPILMILRLVPLNLPPR